MSGLIAKHKRFCREYVLDYNATQAYIRAGYSKNGAGPSGFQLLKKPKIKEYIAEIEGCVIRGLTEKYEVNVERIVSELSFMALANLADLFDKDGKKRPTATLPEELQRVVGMKFSDKVKALEMLGRYLGLFEKDNEQARPYNTMPDSELQSEIKRLTTERNAKLKLITR